MIPNNQLPLQNPMNFQNNNGFVQQPYYNSELNFQPPPPPPPPPTSYASLPFNNTLQSNYNPYSLSQSYNSYNQYQNIQYAQFHQLNSQHQLNYPTLNNYQDFYSGKESQSYGNNYQSSLYQKPLLIGQNCEEQELKKQSQDLRDPESNCQEQLKKWLSERRKNFPTKENIARKKMKEQERIKKGIIEKTQKTELSVLELKLRKKLKILNSNFDKKFQRKRKFRNKNQDSTNYGKSPKKREKMESTREREHLNEELPENIAIMKEDYEKLKCLAGDSNMEEIKLNCENEFNRTQAKKVNNNGTNIESDRKQCEINSLTDSVNQIPSKKRSNNAQSKITNPKGNKGKNNQNKTKNKPNRPKDNNYFKYKKNNILAHLLRPEAIMRRSISPAVQHLDFLPQEAIVISPKRITYDNPFHTQKNSQNMQKTQQTQQFFQTFRQTSYNKQGSNRKTVNHIYTKPENMKFSKGNSDRIEEKAINNRTKINSELRDLRRLKVNSQALTKATYGDYISYPTTAVNTTRLSIGKKESTNYFPNTSYTGTPNQRYKNPYENFISSLNNISQTHKQTNTSTQATSTQYTQSHSHPHNANKTQTSHFHSRSLNHTHTNSYNPPTNTSINTSTHSKTHTITNSKKITPKHTTPQTTITTTQQHKSTHEEHDSNPYTHNTTKINNHSHYQSNTPTHLNNTNNNNHLDLSHHSLDLTFHDSLNNSNHPLSYFYIGDTQVSFQSNLQNTDQLQVMGVKHNINIDRDIEREKELASLSSPRSHRSPRDNKEKNKSNRNPNTETKGSSCNPIDFNGVNSNQRKRITNININMNNPHNIHVQTQNKIINLNRKSLRDSAYVKKIQLVSDRNEKKKDECSVNMGSPKSKGKVLPLSNNNSPRTSNFSQQKHEDKKQSLKTNKSEKTITNSHSISCSKIEVHREKSTGKKLNGFPIRKSFVKKKPLNMGVLYNFLEEQHKKEKNLKKSFTCLKEASLSSQLAQQLGKTAGNSMGLSNNNNIPLPIFEKTPNVIISLPKTALTRRHKCETSATPKLKNSIKRLFTRNPSQPKPSQKSSLFGLDSEKKVILPREQMKKHAEIHRAKEIKFEQNIDTLKITTYEQKLLDQYSSFNFKELDISKHAIKLNDSFPEKNNAPLSEATIGSQDNPDDLLDQANPMQTLQTPPNEPTIPNESNQLNERNQNQEIVQNEELIESTKEEEQANYYQELADFAELKDTQKVDVGIKSPRTIESEIDSFNTLLSESRHNKKNLIQVVLNMNNHQQKYYADETFTLHTEEEEFNFPQKFLSACASPIYGGPPPARGTLLPLSNIKQIGVGVRKPGFNHNSKPENHNKRVTSQFENKFPRRGGDRHSTTPTVNQGCGTQHFMQIKKIGKINKINMNKLTDYYSNLPPTSVSSNRAQNYARKGFQGNCNRPNTSNLMHRRGASMYSHIK